MHKPVVEILYFDGCPNYEQTHALVAELAAELGLKPTIELINVPDDASAARRRFLGSPTVRVDGRDVEPGAQERSDFVRACRVYGTEQGLAGRPDPRWIREMLARSSSS